MPRRDCAERVVERVVAAHRATDRVDARRDDHVGDVLEARVRRLAVVQRDRIGRETARLKVQLGTTTECLPESSLALVSPALARR